ncbi:MAG: HAD-IIB family hydrolase [Longimicrobiales bacterium]
MTGSGPGLVVFTDLDATLLDEATYSFDPAREALAALAERHIPLVLCSSKTRAEMERWALALGTSWPLVTENGGSILWAEGGAYRAQTRGTPRSQLVAALADIAGETGSVLRGFASLSVGDVEAITGLGPAAAREAMAREHDEPFLVDAGDMAAVAAAAGRRGLHVTRGGRFHHLAGRADKGQAVREILAAYRADGSPVPSVALGDAANDLSMLQAVDRPILVPRPGGAPDATLARSLPHAELAPAPGPEGWNAAVMTVLRGERLPTVRGAPRR